MAIQDIKARYWALIGLAVGSLMGASQLFWREDLGQGVGRVLAQEEFERELLEKAPGGQPKLTRLLVHPADSDGRMWVVGLRMPDELKTGPQASQVFRYAAAVPYGPLKQSGGGELMIVQYLQKVKAAHPDATFTFRYAWWELPWCVLAAWSAGGLLAIGIAWPVLLRLMAGAGLGRAKTEEPTMDLSRFESGQKPQPAKVAQPFEGVERYVDAILEEQENQPVQPADATPPEPPKAAVPVLDGGPLEPQQAAPEEQKSYRGEFYPVARGIVPADEDSAGDEHDSVDQAKRG